MMKLFSATLAAAAVFAFITPAAEASVLIEPYLGYHLGKKKQENVANSNDNVKGVTYGGRLGYQQLGFMLGLDYMSGAWKDDNDPVADLTPSDLGAFVGYNLPIMLRVYGVYGFSSKMTAEVNSNKAKLEGHSFKLGVGFTSLPFVSINVEYMSATYDKYNGLSLGSNKVKADMYGLTVSLPFNL
jgi:hypothetical protein